MRILIALAILLVAGVLLKISIIFAPISLAITMLVTKHLKQYYCNHYNCGNEKHNFSGGKGNSEHKNMH